MTSALEEAVVACWRGRRFCVGGGRSRVLKATFDCVGGAMPWLFCWRRHVSVVGGGHP